MSNKKDHVVQLKYVLIISLFFLLSFILLFLLRSHDDNRLVSWKDIFEEVSPIKIFFALIGGIFLSYIFSLIRSFERWPGITLFLLSFLISVLFWNEPEVIVDASRYFTQAKHLAIYGTGFFIREWGKDISAWTDLPLMPFIYGLIFKVFGESRIYIQIFTSLMFSMSTVFTYLAGKTLWDKNTGFYAGLFLMGIPYLFTQVPLMLVDVPTMFFFTLSVYVFFIALEKGGAFIPLSSIVIFLAFFSKYSVWLMMSVFPVIVAVYSLRPSAMSNETSPLPHPPLLRGGNSKLQTPNYLYRSLLVVFISGILIGIVFWYKFDVFSEQIRILMTYQKEGLRRWGEGFFSTFFFQINPFITLFALYSVFAAVKKKDIRYLIIIWLLILVFLFQIKRIRYLMIVFPMFCLMASYGLAQIKNKSITRFVALSVFAYSLIIALFAYLPFIKTISMVNLRDAGRFLNSLDSRGAEVLLHFSEDPVLNPSVSVPILDIYTDKKVTYEYDKAFLLSKGNTTDSAFRFAWEYKNPEYYTNNSSDTSDMAFVVITDTIDSDLSSHIKEKTKEFNNSINFNVPEKRFSYTTYVTVYHN